MGNGATRRWLALAAVTTASVGLLVAIADEPHAAPGELRPAALATAAIDFRPAIATAAVTLEAEAAQRAASAMPAPLGETRPERERPAARPNRTVAVGHGARGMYDDAFAYGFRADTEFEVALAACDDRDAIELVRLGRAGMALLGGSLSPADLRAGMRQIPIGLELYALAVAVDFPLQSISSAEMRQVLTGEVRDWQSLGCDRGAIVVVVPAQRDLAARAAGVMVQGKSFPGHAVRVTDSREVADQLLRNPGAVAVVRVGSTPPTGMQLLQVDWTAPSAEAFRYGTYPYGVPLQVVTAGDPDDCAGSFLGYATSDSGRELLGRSLQLPVRR